MIGLQRAIIKYIALILSVAAAAGVGGVGYLAWRTSRTIFDLLGENRHLRQAITNLTEQRQIGYAKVLEQEERDGRLFTRILFVVTDPEDKARRLLECTYEIEGDVVHFDALIVKFGGQVVMDGKEKALYLWRRIYGEKTPPEKGFAIEIKGEAPARYAKLFEKLAVEDRDLFWDEIWKLSDDPNRLAAAGVQAVYGSAVYKRLRPGLIYIFNLTPNGEFYPETVPAL